MTGVRARKLGVPHALTAAFLVSIAVPACPILGLDLHYGGGRLGGYVNSPSVDRIVPSLGYVPSNVAIISNRANTLKSDMTEEQLENLLAYLRLHRSAH